MDRRPIPDHEQRATYLPQELAQERDHRRPAERRRDWQALTTEEAGRRGALDPDQLRLATERGLVILTYNISDFPGLHTDLLGRGESHAGVIIATQSDPRRSIRALLNLLSVASTNVHSLSRLTNRRDHSACDVVVAPIVCT
ncbi:MAG: DUF5615 family PIN-like protein [Dehalococcoidia bacterium]